MCKNCLLILKQLDDKTVSRLMEGERKTEAIENETMNYLSLYFDYLERQFLKALEMHVKPLEIDSNQLELYLLINMLNSLRAGFEVQPRLPKNEIKLSKYLDIKIPKNPAELRRWWDIVRRRIHVPKNIQANAISIKNKYIEKTQSIWSKYSEDFTSGRSWNQNEVKTKVRYVFQVTKSRADMIVATETTRYYNQATVNYYEDVDEVTHYLFICLRDKATTKWCKSRQHLIYKKGTKLQIREKPPLHYRCRSRILPLTPLNPTHLKLIEDKTKWRENNKCEPLLKGWNNNYV